MTTSQLLVALSLAVTSPALAQESPSSEGATGRDGSTGREEARLSDQPFPGALVRDAAGRPAFAVTCVLDALTGEPISGARLIAVHEATYPLAGEWWSTRSAVSDAEGWVRLRLDDLERGPWLYVEAAGYAPTIRSVEELEPGLRLERGEEVEVWVRDGLDRPVEGVRLGWLLGCGHTPDVRIARTDARGRTTLVDVARGVGELWPVARGFGSDYRDLPDSAQALVRLESTAQVRGRVLDREGQALEGLYVGNSHGHRGAWSRTDSAGRFEVFGLPDGYGVAVQGADDSFAALGFVEQPADGRELILTVPQEIDQATVRVRIHLHGTGTGAGVEGLAASLVRTGDGFTLRAYSDEQGRVELNAPAGTYAVQAGGGLSGWEPVQVELELDREHVALGTEPAPLGFSLIPSPRIHVDAQGLPEGAKVILVGALEERAVGLAEPAADLRQPLAVPSTGRLGLRVELEDRAWAIELDAPQRTSETRVELQAPEPTVLRMSFADPAGEAAPGWAVLVDEEELEPADIARARELGPAEETLELPTWRIGAVSLWAVPAGDGLAPRRLRLDLPIEPATLELGRVRFAEPELFTLTLLEADGEPLVPAHLELRRPGLRLDVTTDEQGRLPDGALELRPGDLLRIESAGLPSFHAELSGPGPWTVTRPSGSLYLEVTDERARPLSGFALWIDGELFEAHGSSATLPGLAPGSHRAVVSAAGHRSLVLTFELAQDEQRVLGAALPRSP